ncbi:MAG: SapC family protein [Rubrivivax sp.]|nr:SapC family protein [Rubrivivax sp.]
MINPNLFIQPVAVDSVQHRGLRLSGPVADWSVTANLNAIFLASVEFGDACCEYPIVFIDAGKDEASGKMLVAPIAVLGITDKSNLFVEAGRWRAQYVPALLRAYPFGIARQDESRVLVVIDQNYAGWSQTEGQALFDEQGQPSELLTGMRDQLEKVETEIQRTRLFGSVLVEADLLQPMRFDATLPDGKTLAVEGFLTVDEKRFADLPDATLTAFHRNGVLGLIHAHQISLRHMRRLVEWHAARLNQAGAATASP